MVGMKSLTDEIDWLDWEDDGYLRTAGNGQ
jgi:hypothetical protein